MCLFSTIGVLAILYLPFDFFNHMRLQYACSLAVACGISAFLSLRKLAFASFILIVLNIVPALALYVPPHVEPITNAKPLKILDMNLLYSVTDYGPAIAQIKATNPDILVFQEFSPYAVQAMKDVLITYPYAKAIPANNPSGHGIYSRIPLSDINESPSFQNLFTVEDVNFQIGGKKILLVNLHTFPPASVRSILANLSVLDYLKQLRHSGQEMILIGDYNATPWSRYFNLLTDELKLRDTEAGLGPQFSWPAGVVPFYVPIDHCCISSGIGLSVRKLLAKTESDHLALYVELAIPGN
jgi:endonuclease/exonuclease/phosphatase (EEP) superfamily protein YafD